MTEKALKGRREYMAEYRRKNREHIREYNRQWRAANPDKVAANANRYWEKQAERLEEAAAE